MEGLLHSSARERLSERLLFEQDQHDKKGPTPLELGQAEDTRSATQGLRGRSEHRRAHLYLVVSEEAGGSGAHLTGLPGLG